ncbi:MAG TPA: sialate O-acetylesterase [Planctomycetes bacterium]|nr:sialate O-acetylesterase [Planctomycetota bacterium]
MMTTLSTLLLLTLGVAGIESHFEQNKTADTVRVFLLAGQSNMEGHAVVDLVHEQHYNGGKGTLIRLMDDPVWKTRLSHLRDKEGNWTSRNDVWVRYQPSRGPLKKGPLSIGYAVHEGRHHFGPELQIGHQLGHASKDPVLLIKTCWGGKSLHVDFRPPSAGGTTGPFYKKMIEEYREAIGSVEKDFPSLKGKKLELTGFFWFQGWNDMYTDGALENYTQNFIHLVEDLREEFDVPRLPVVIGQTGNADSSQLHAAQAATEKNPQHKGSIKYVPTRQFLFKAEDSPNTGHGHHWFGHAGSYFEAGNSMGEAMIKLLSQRKK